MELTLDGSSEHNALDPRKNDFFLNQFSNQPTDVDVDKCLGQIELFVLLHLYESCS